MRIGAMTHGLQSSAIAAAVALSMATSTVSCQPVGSKDADRTEVPVYRVRYGMTVDEFAAVNKTNDVKTPGLGMLITGPHVIVFEVEGQPHPFILRNVGTSENASTSIYIDYNFDDMGASTISGVSSTLDGGDDDSNMSFTQAQRACEQAVTGFAGTGWKDRTPGLSERFGEDAFWLDPSRVESGLRKAPEQEAFPMREFVNGRLLAECAVSRNNFQAASLGFENMLGAYGNDPSAPIYLAELSFLSRERLEPDWEKEAEPK